MRRNLKKTGFIIIVLMAALLLPGWMVVQSLTAFPTDRQTVSGESSALKSRLADSRLGLNRQNPSEAVMADRPFSYTTEDMSASAPAKTTFSSIVPSSERYDGFEPVDPSSVLSALSTESSPTDLISSEPAPSATLTTSVPTQSATVSTTTPPPTTTAPVKSTTVPPTSAAPAPTTTAPTTTAPVYTTTTPTTAAPAPTTTVPTTAAPAPTTTATVNTSSASYWQSEILRLTNEERAKEGLPALKAAPSALSSAAATRATEISLAGWFSHTRPDGTNWFTAITQNGVSYRTAGENIAYCTSGSLTPTGVMNLWMNSDGHRKNILNNGTPPYTTLGVGFYRNNGKDYFVQLFIG